MSWIFLSEGDQGLASASHRVYLLAEGLKERGHSVQIFSGRRRRVGPARWWIPGPLALAQAWKALSPGDQLVIHRCAHPGVAALAIRARKLGATVIFDVDDAIHRHRRLGMAHPLYSALPQVLKQCHEAWCGSHDLLPYASRFTEGQFRPTPVDPAFLRERSKLEFKPTVAWMGNGPVHAQNLLLLREPLRELAAVRPMKLILASALGDPTLVEAFSNIPGLEVDFGFAAWVDTSTLAERVAGAHICVMPLVDTPFNRGKCAMKALEAMAMGIPVVMSPVGENSLIAGEGQTFARLADSAEEWVNALGALLEDSENALALGLRGQKLIRERYLPQRFVEDAERLVARRGI